MAAATRFFAASSLNLNARQRVARLSGTVNPHFASLDCDAYSPARRACRRKGVGGGTEVGADGKRG